MASLLKKYRERKAEEKVSPQTGAQGAAPLQEIRENLVME